AYYYIFLFSKEWLEKEKSIKFNNDAQDHQLVADIILRITLGIYFI
ncbi:MAG: hypothetical protein HY934_09775, partial [Candidatus Firestonebacteria bacterium]|nr:hypothetical protein [Candidatus Firestonebacteria bacterium]